MCLVLGAFAGHKLDEKFETGIILTLVCLTIGLIVALFGVFRMVQPLMKQYDQDQNKGDEEG